MPEMNTRKLAKKMYPYILKQLPLISRPRESWCSLGAEKVKVGAFSIGTTDHVPELSAETYET